MTEQQNKELPLNGMSEAANLSSSNDSPVDLNEVETTAESDSASYLQGNRLTPGAIFFGAIVTLAFVGFVFLAEVTVHPFDKVDRRMQVIDVWSRLRNHLPDVAHPTLLRVVFDISIILIVVGSLACVWLALLAPSKSRDDVHDEDHQAHAAHEPHALST